MKLNILICCFILALVSCKKNETKIPNQTNSNLPKIEVVNGALRVANQTDFVILTNLSGTAKSSLLNNLQNDGFTQFTNDVAISNNNRMVGNSNIPDEIADNNKQFLDLLNSNGVISIGDDTYRLDYSNNQLFVISNVDAADPTKYNSFLAATQPNSYVGAFPLQIDVLDAVALGYRTMPSNPSTTIEDGLFKGFPGPQQRGHEKMYWNNFKPSVKDDWRNDKRMDGLISYDAFGIFFHLYGKEKYFEKNGLSMWIATTGGNWDWKVTYDLYCKPRKRNAIVENRVVLNPGFGTNSNENKLDKTFYQGSRRVDDALVRWDVTQPSAREVEVYRGQIQTNQQFVFYNSQPLLGIMNNYIGSYVPNLVPASAHPSKPFLFKW